MTHVIIYKDSHTSEIVGFKTEGHAGYAESGYDIVCAATSVLIINTINSIEQFTDMDCEVITDEENAIIQLMVCSPNQSRESMVLLKALELGLSSIAEDNPNYLSITFEEV
jgi:uncharacterized protein YsxB (DUF464 family)